MTVLLSFPFANANVRADLLSLQRAGMLSLFCTTIAWRQHRTLSHLLPSAIRSELERRIFAGVDAGRIRTFPQRELIRQVARRLGLTALTCHETGWASADGVMRAFDEQVARQIRGKHVAASAVYAYEYAALRTFEAASAVGMRRFYELPTGYWRAAIRIFKEERERNPAWAATMEGLRDSDKKHERKDAELRAADHIVVPSDFVRSTLKEFPGLAANVDVIPYGAPPPHAAASANRRRHEKLRILYVGNLTQRKGISYLFEAMRSLEGAATLTMVGVKAGGYCSALEAEIKRHQWLGPVPHARVLEIMRRHDVFVFPSLFEGFALVILEAMAQGLPIITTRNSGGTMAVDDGTSGFIIPIRDSNAIVERVLELRGDPDRLASMGMAALWKAEQMSWAARGRLMLDMIRSRLGADDREAAERSPNRV
jgi:starch synthase